MAFGIVSTFLVLNSPRIVASSIEVYHSNVILNCIENSVRYVPSMNYYKLDFFARFFMVVNSAINFLIYCAVSTTFQVIFFFFFFFFWCCGIFSCSYKIEIKVRRLGFFIPFSFACFLKHEMHRTLLALMRFYKNVTIASLLYGERGLLSKVRRSRILRESVLPTLKKKNKIIKCPLYIIGSFLWCCSVDEENQTMFDSTV